MVRPGWKEITVKYSTPFRPTNTTTAGGQRENTRYVPSPKSGGKYGGY